MQPALHPGLPRALRTIAWFLFAGGLWLLLAAPAAGAEVAAVYSKAVNGYARTRLPDNSFQSEAYTFVEGGLWGGPLHDKTVDSLTFLKIAGIIAGPLAGQNYRPATDPQQTRLLIFVYWGTTSGTDDTRSSTAYQNAQDLIKDEAIDLVGKTPQEVADAKSAGDAAFLMLGLQNSIRDQNNYQNAKILGFRDDLLRARNLQFAASSEDLITELEGNRYFVVLKAYDFQLAWKKKQRKLLWETRFSIREQGNSFSDQLPAMALYASRYFGQDSGGLVRKPLPNTKVELGETKYLDFEPAK